MMAEANPGAALEAGGEGAVGGEPVSAEFPANRGSTGNFIHNGGLWPGPPHTGPQDSR